MAEITKTGGRPATAGVIGGGIALAVGNPGTALPPGFSWRSLTELARLETGHTPSRRHPEYWDGDIPWIGIRDATENHGRRITDTKQHVTTEGVANSSTRLLPANTVCLSRTASVGYVVTMGRPMCTSQDFVNWVCGPGLDHRYLHYIFMLEQGTVRRFAHGTTHQTVYFPEAKAFHVAIPEPEEQRSIADTLAALDDKVESNRRFIASSAELLRTLADSLSLSAGEAPLGDLVTVATEILNPADLGAELLDHFSIPAFDAGQVPDRVQGHDVLSNKQFVREPSVLVSRLNPRTPRIWYAVPEPDVPAGCSGEFLVLTPIDGLSLGGLWLAVSGERFVTRLQQRATGTSGSHQRVRPADALSCLVPDIRAIDPSLVGVADVTLEIMHQRRRESAVLLAMRDALLPALLSGRLRVARARELAGLDD